MVTSSSAARVPARGIKPLLLMVALLAAVLAVLFFRSFDPDEIVFSNDGPLGGLMAALNRMPSVLVGAWHDLNWLGTQSPTPAINITSMLRLVTGPLLFSKIFPPVALFIFGLGAWAFFRQLRLSPLACVLGGLAATLSSHFFSTACWGVASQTIAFGMDFFALALLVDTNSRMRWIRVILAGFAVGMNIMEGYDVGAIFSLFVAAFVAFQAWIGEGEAGVRVGRGLLRLSMLTACAILLSTEALVSLVGTQILGVAGMEQTQAAKEGRWDFATQWSLPKAELPRVLIPGLFGYRMDTPGGGNYWGKVGESPGWSQHHEDPEWARVHPGAYPRFSGGGEYAGLLVVAVALWAVVQALGKKDSVFSLEQRKWIGFWAVAAFISLLLCLGRYAPFYYLFYDFPYCSNFRPFSNIRNASKFLHPFHWSLVILFAYGMHGLSRRYLEGATSATAALADHLKAWWAKTRGIDRRWVVGSVLAVVVSLIGWLVYASSRPELEKHLMSAGFADQSIATQIALFSVSAVGGYVIWLVVTLALLTLVLSGWFGGRRAKWGAVLLGLLLVVDLARADTPWIIYQNYKEKYATNDLVEFLRGKPYEHRVSIFPLERFLRLEELPAESKGLGQLYYQLNSIYRVEWMQHHFQYYNIQCLDIIQMPRAPKDMEAFERALEMTPLRRWELTNTRYLLGLRPLLDLLNQHVDPVGHRFKVALAFDLYQERADGPIMTRITTNGPYALFEFTGALPRAKLYSRWQVSTNDATALQQLASPAFDPTQTVLVANALANSPATANTNQSAGTVEFTSYAPKDILLRAKAETASVLLLNDRFDPNWQVFVDGRPETLLRCNYLMRGVQVPAGEHQIEFRFAPPVKWLYVSLAAILIGIGLMGLLAFAKTDPLPTPAPPAPTPARK